MLNKWIIISGLFIFTTIIIIGCKKDKIGYTLPSITQNGANTIGCKIDGNVWVPFSKCSISTSCDEISTVFMHPNGDNFLPLSFATNFTRKESNAESFLIINTFQFGLSYATTINQTGNVFDSLFIEYFNGSKLYEYYGIQNQFQDSTNSFIITKIDTLNKIMSGTFHFRLVNYPDTVYITEGRFDFKLQDFCKCSP